MASSSRNVATQRNRVLRLRVATPAVVLCLIASGSVAAQVPSVDSLQNLLKRATYVFEGTVKRWNAVADPSLTATPQTAVVHVSRLFVCPQQVGLFRDEDVTITFHDPSAAPAGTTGWFLGRGWSVGNHIATSVVSIVRTPTTAQNQALVANLHQALQLSAKDALDAIVTASSVVVLATVDTISEAKYAASSPRSENAERWSTVRLTVDSVRSSRDSVVWVAPRDSFRNITILAPATIGYYAPGTAQLTKGSQRIFALDSIFLRPNLQKVDATAIAFIPNDRNIRPLADAALLGNALPNRVFSSEPPHECSQPLK